MSGQGEDDGAEKSFDPTPEKLRKAREEGQIPKSNDLNAASGYLALLLICTTLGGTIISEAAEGLMALLANAPELATLMFEGAPRPVMGPILLAVALPLSVWFAGPALLVLLNLIVQRAISVTPKNLMPKLSRISIISNAKNKFGRNGLFEFFKSTTKMLIFCVVAAFFLRSHIGTMIGALRMEAPQIAAMMGSIIADLMLYIVVIALLIGAIDFLWQRAEHHRKNMMTRKEIRDEQKDSEGDPEFKQQRRQRGQEIAMNAMLSDVPNADVIIVNPTHYAVALTWDRESREPPKCVAKGVDEIAAKIREIAIENGIPIHSDPPTARALHGTLEIGDTVQYEHFVAVAAAIRFADEMRKRARM